jgi:hypothetical protein
MWVGRFGVVYKWHLEVIDFSDKLFQIVFESDFEVLQVFLLVDLDVFDFE